MNINYSISPIKKSEQKEEKSSPPFLNSLIASATILSYVGETPKVVRLLNRLSLSTVQYLESHTSFLNAFLKGPRIPTAILFDEHESVNLDRNWQKEVVENGKTMIMGFYLCDNNTHFTVMM